MPFCASQLSLLTLPNETIIEILTYCPIDSILKLESTCKDLHQLCQARVVWKTLMRRLDIEQAPNWHPFQSLESVSSSDLRKRVISAVRRYRTWHDPGKIPDLRALELPLPHLPLDRIIKVRLLPGGKEVLLAAFGKVELWSIESQECLSIIPVPEDHTNNVGFDFELVHGGTVLVVAIVCEDLVTLLSSLLRIYTYNFSHRTLELVFQRRVPLVSPSRIMLRGDFFISCIPRNFETVVVNWKRGEALILDFVDQAGVRIDARAKLLAENNLIAFVQDPEAGFCAVKLPLSTLRDFWSDGTDHTAWRHVLFRPSDPGYSVLRLPYFREQVDIDNRRAGFGPWTLAHHVFTPTWRHNAPTEILVVAYMCGPGGQTPMRLFSFRLQLSHSSGLPLDEDTRSLSLVTSTCAPVTRLPRNPRNISNAGLMFSLRQQLQCFSFFSETEQPMNEAELSPGIAPYTEEIEPTISSVEPWSGAIAIRMPGSIKVLYFD